MKKIFLLLFFISLIFVSSAQTYTLSSNLGTITTCSGTFVDGGGSGSNYANSSDYTVTFCSGSSANVSVSFSSFNVENGYDHLYIYDGPSTASPLVDNATGNLGAFVVQSSGSCITFNFMSDVSITYAGWSGTISCAIPCAAPTAGGTITNQTAPVMVCPGEAIN
ncbi:MAG: CUB domain-containing protein, partial [Bacteroidales bacterium]